MFVLSVVFKNFSFEHVSILWGILFKVEEDTDAFIMYTKQYAKSVQKVHKCTSFLKFGLIYSERGVLSGGKNLPTPFLTPESIILQKISSGYLTF